MRVKIEAGLGALMVLCGAATSQAAPNTTERISVPSQAAVGPDHGGGTDNGNIAVSEDGRYISFTSFSSTLVSNDSVEQDIFVRDRLLGQTELVSTHGDAVLQNREPLNSVISADGRFVAFSATFDENYIFIADRQSKQIQPVSVGYFTGQPERTKGEFSISADGRYVAFISHWNFVPGDTNGVTDVFVRDTVNGTTERINVKPTGGQSIGNVEIPTISSDGRYVLFGSLASDLVPGDDGSYPDVYIRDRQSSLTERISVSALGILANGASSPCRSALSADARHVAFVSRASNLDGGSSGRMHIFVKDRQTGGVRRVTPDSFGDLWGGGNFRDPECAISSDGRYVSFATATNNLVPGDTNAVGDVFVRDMVTDGIERVSVSSGGGNLVLPSMYPMMSGNGRFVAFATSANNLGPVDDNSSLFSQDIYIRERHVSALVLSPRNLIFPNTTVNASSAAQQVQVLNTSNTAQSFTEATLTGLNGNQFTRSTNCGTLLAAGASCVVSVSFKPTSIGAKSATLNVNGGGAGLRTVALTGSGEANASFSLNPSLVDFGAQAKGTTQSETVFVANTGSQPLPIVSKALGGLNPLQFSLSTTCGTTLAVATSCQIAVAFTPKSNGTKSATLTVSAGSSAGSKAVNLQGVGATTKFSLVPNIVAFGSQPRNTNSTAKVVTLANTSSVSMPLIQLAISGTNANQFSQTTTCGSVLVAGKSCTINIRFRPTSVGNKAAALAVQAGGGAPSASVSLSGKGT